MQLNVGNDPEFIIKKKEENNHKFTAVYTLEIN